MTRTTRWFSSSLIALAATAFLAGAPAASAQGAPCSDQASCEALFDEAFGCNSLESCRDGFPQCEPTTTCQAYFTHAVQVFTGQGGGGGAEPPCSDQASCQALLESLGGGGGGGGGAPGGGDNPFPCSDQPSCQAWFEQQLAGGGGGGGAPAPPCTDQATCTAFFEGLGGGGSGGGSGSGSPPPSSNSSPPPSSGSSPSDTSGSSTSSEPAADKPKPSHRVALVAGCDARQAKVTIAGKDRSRIKSVTFYAGKRKLRRDFRGPFSAEVPRGAKIRAVVAFRDGSEKTVTARAKHC